MWHVIKQYWPLFGIPFSFLTFLTGLPKHIEGLQTLGGWLGMSSGTEWAWWNHVLVAIGLSGVTASFYPLFQYLVCSPKIKKFKFLVPLIEDCLRYVRYRDYDYKDIRIEKVGLLHKKLEELHIPAPVPIAHGEGFSNYHISRGIWRKCLEQWLPLAREGKLNQAEKVYPEVKEQRNQGVFDPSREVYTYEEENP